MPVLDASDYKPPLLFRNGHTNTMYPFLFRKKIKPSYQRERFITSDDDFIDLDFLRTNSKKLAILCHGLEGNSDSQYMQYTSSLLAENGWDAMVFNFRSCSGEMNLQLKMYHSGWTTDLHEIITKYENDYNEISIVGVSLGGNMILKYTTDKIYRLSSKIKSVVAISSPVDLSASSQKIITRQNILYDKRFRITLLDKVKQKHELFPDDIPIGDITKVKTLWDFDEYFTGPIHGFDGAEDYYAKSNSKQFLHQTKLPTLLITAQDDPFLTKESLIFDIARATTNLYFMAPKFGGHVGFTTFGSNYYWNENKTLQFINAPNDFVSHYRIIK
ncbi:MAG: putative alpha/beta-fold hydrolase [Saprospiraceae bacterium]|jgi:predicted alpha/beta-fold hydrolase